jgi:hypothetical protein
MRFKEFNPKRSDQQVDELMPAIGMALKGVGGAAIQATRNAATMGSKAVAGAAKGVKTVANTAKTVAQTNLGQTSSTPMAIPAVGSEIVLPDKDTKKPASYTIKGMKGSDVELAPVTTAAKTNDPKLSIKVNRRDLENTLKAVSPETQDKRTL